MAIDLANPVNWQHPLNRGLVHLTLPMQNRRYLQNQAGRPRNNTGYASQSSGVSLGNGIKFNAVSDNILMPSSYNPVAGSAQVTFHIDFHWNGSSGRIWGKWGATDAENSWLVEILAATTVGFASSGGLGGVSGYQVAHSTGTISSGRNIVSVSRNAATILYVINGATTTTVDDVVGFNGNIITSTGSHQFNYEPASALNGCISGLRFASAYNRAMSNEEMISYQAAIRSERNALLNYTRTRTTIFLPPAGSFKSAWARGSNVILQPGVLT